MKRPEDRAPNRRREVVVEWKDRLVGQVVGSVRIPARVWLMGRLRMGVKQVCPLGAEAAEPWDSLAARSGIEPPQVTTLRIRWMPVGSCGAQIKIHFAIMDVAR